MERWPHQEFLRLEVPRRIEAGERAILVTSPTGGGKTLALCDMIEWGVSQGWHVVLYTTRRLLISQLEKVLDKAGIKFGVRASGYHDDRHLPVQISSLPTERERVLKKGIWDVHGAGGKTLALVDEAHLSGNETAQKILSRHEVFVGVTATPVDLGHLYTSLVVSGTPSELRACGALVPAYHYGPDEPDMKDFKTNVKTGEYSENDVRKAIMTKCIWGNVSENYDRYNPEQRPTILFGPDVKGSQFFAEKFTERGIRAAHIDSDGIWLDGEYTKCGLEQRESVLGMVRRGEVKVLCNRFVAREGLDLPEVSHLILATVFGSLKSYLQACGRGLRACPEKKLCSIQDHGGMYHRHGSVNADREWNLEYTERILAGIREKQFQEQKIRQPIRCMKCSLIRASGPVCPQCGHKGERRSRMVMQTDGRLVEHSGDIYKPRIVKMERNTEDIWKSCYFRCKGGRSGKSFLQCEALFMHENGYYPPRDLPFMPIHDIDFFRPVRDVPVERLVRRQDRE